MTLLRSRLKRLGPGRYEARCGKISCRGLLGGVYAAGASISGPPYLESASLGIATKNEWWPPAGYFPDAGTWGPSPRAASQYRRQKKLQGQGINPTDRPASEPAFWGRRSKPISSAMELADPIAQMMTGRSEFPSLRRVSAIPQQTEFPFRVKCPECGWSQILQAPPPLTDDERSGIVRAKTE